MFSSVSFMSFRKLRISTGDCLTFRPSRRYSRVLAITYKALVLTETSIHTYAARASSLSAHQPKGDQKCQIALPKPLQYFNHHNNGTINDTTATMAFSTQPPHHHTLRSPRTLPLLLHRRHHPEMLLRRTPQRHPRRRSVSPSPHPNPHQTLIPR